MIDEETNQLILLLEDKIKNLSDEDRLRVFNQITSDYCEHCGRYDADTYRGCQCWNDE